MWVSNNALATDRKKPRPLKSKVLGIEQTGRPTSQLSKKISGIKTKNLELIGSHLGERYYTLSMRVRCLIQHIGSPLIDTFSAHFGSLSHRSMNLWRNAEHQLA